MGQRTCIHGVLESSPCGDCDDMPHNAAARAEAAEITRLYWRHLRLHRKVELGDALAKAIRSMGHDGTQDDEPCKALRAYEADNK